MSLRPEDDSSKNSPNSVGEPEELLRWTARTSQLGLDLFEERAWLHSMEPLRSLQPPIHVEEVELMFRGREAVVGIPRIAHEGSLEPLEHLSYHILASTRGDPIHDGLEVGEHPHPPVLTSDTERGLVPVDHGDHVHLLLQSLVERSESFGGPSLHLQHGRGAHLDPVTLSQTVHDLRHTQPEHPKVNDPGHQGVPEGTVRRVGRGRFHSLVTTRAGVARDLHVNDEGLGGREVGDRPPTDLERFPPLRATRSALVEGEWGGGGVGAGALPRAPGVALLATGRVRFSGWGGPTVEHAARGDPSRFGGEVTGREKGRRGLDPSQFLLSPTELLPKLSVLFLQLVRPFQSLADRPLLLGVEGQGFIVLDEREDLHRVPSVHVPLRRGTVRSPESTIVRTAGGLQAVRKGEWLPFSNMTIAGLPATLYQCYLDAEISGYSPTSLGLVGSYPSFSAVVDYGIYTGSTVSDLLKETGQWVAIHRLPRGTCGPR